MKRIFFLLLLIVAVAACSDDEGTGGESAKILDPEGNEVSLSVGESIEFPAEDRRALVMVLKGDVVSGAQPYVTELVNVFDGTYRDHDEGQGPESWIMEASVLDADGNVLWHDRENGLFQLLEFLEIILEQQSPIPVTAAQVHRFVKINYPELIEFALRVPIGIPGGTTYVLTMPDMDGERYEVGRYEIADLMEQAVAPQYEGEVATIVDSGPPEDNLDVVIIGDGYLADQRGEFDIDAQAVAEALITADPFRTHKEVVNIHTIWTPSAEVGAGYDCTGNPLVDRDCKEDMRDTVYGTVFVITALADILNLTLDSSDRVALPLQVARMYEVATLADYDEIILISQTRRPSGFAGLYVSVVTTFDTNRLEFPNVAVHELGHSFGVLGDEYNLAGDPCLKNEPRVPLPVNIAEAASADIFKWDRWFMGPTPVPTPEADKEVFPVGAYQGAYNCPELFRPAHTCKMNGSEEVDFCPVCNEQVTRRLYSVIDPMANEAPVAEATESGGVRLSVSLHESELWDVIWTLDGEEVGTEPVLELTKEQLPKGDLARVNATIYERTGFVILEDPTLRHEVEFQVGR